MGVYAALATPVVLLARRAVRGPEARRAWPLVIPTLFFLALTQHPFPDPACPAPHTQPLLDPLHLLRAIWERVNGQKPLLASLGSLAVRAAAMNLLLCAAIGMALARHVQQARESLLHGAAPSLDVERTQLMGV